MTAAGVQKSKEELELERSVFGDETGFADELAKLGMNDGVESDGVSDDNEGSEYSSEMDGESLFFVDKGDDEENESTSDDSSADPKSDSEDPKAWHDSDDDELQVDLTSVNRNKKLRISLSETHVSGSDYETRLRRQFEKLYPRPTWAFGKQPARHGSAESESDEDYDEEEGKKHLANPLKDLLSQKTNYLSADKARFLPTSDIDIQRLADVTKQLQSQAVVQTIDFHPTQPLVLTGGFDKTLRIYQIDGKVNPLATSLYIENSPFRTALFHPDGKRVFAAGRRKYLYIWDLQTGDVEKVSRLYGHDQNQDTFEKFVISPGGEYVALVGTGGWLNVLSAHSGQWVAAAKIEGDFADLAWTEPSDITIVNTVGDVWIWDVETRQFKTRWRDPSLVGVTTVAQTLKWIALGMENGIVSVYDRLNPKKGLRLSESEPETWEANFVVENLITSVSSLQFNPDGQLLVAASRVKRDSLRLIHVPSFTVFKNWPTSMTPLGHVSTVAWSPNSQMLVAGNEGGYARLWSLNHYTA